MLRLSALAEAPQGVMGLLPKTGLAHIDGVPPNVPEPTEVSVTRFARRHGLVGVVVGKLEKDSPTLRTLKCNFQPIA